MYNVACGHSIGLCADAYCGNAKENSTSTIEITNSYNLQWAHMMGH
jgi:hypothetical protein